MLPHVPLLTPAVREELHQGLREHRQGRQPGKPGSQTGLTGCCGIRWQPYLGEQAEAADAANDAVHLGEARARAGGLRDRGFPSVLQPPRSFYPAGADGDRDWCLGLGTLGERWAGRRKACCSEDKQQGGQSGHCCEKKMALRELVGSLAAPIPSAVSKGRGGGKYIAAARKWLWSRAKNSCSHLGPCSRRLPGPWHRGLEGEGGED